MCLHYSHDKDGVIKVSDFGLTEDMYSSNYYRQERSWTGREGIETNVFDENTDVVSQMSHIITLVAIIQLFVYDYTTAHIALIWIYSMCLL